MGTSIYHPPVCHRWIGLIVTLDYEEDYHLIRAIHEDLTPANYGVSDIVKWIARNPELHQACIDVRKAETA